MAIIRHPRKRPTNLWNFPREEKFVFTHEQYRKALREGKPLFTLDIQIKCLEGKSHTVRCSFPGEMKLMHHLHMDDEKTMMRLGGEKPECIKWLEVFRKDKSEACRGRYYAMKLLRAIEDLREMRNQERNKYTDMFDNNFIDRALMRWSAISEDVTNNIHKNAGVGRQKSWRYNRPLVDPTSLSAIGVKVKFVFQDKLNKPYKEEPEDESEH